MRGTPVELDEDLIAAMRRGSQSVQRTARELIVLELFRRGTLSRGKAAELRGMARAEFIRHAARLGIPFLAMSDDEWEAERAQSAAL